MEFVVEKREVDMPQNTSNRQNNEYIYPFEFKPMNIFIPLTSDVWMHANLYL